MLPRGTESDPRCDDHPPAQQQRTHRKSSQITIALCGWLVASCLFISLPTRFTTILRARANKPFDNCNSAAATTLHISHEDQSLRHHNNAGRHRTSIPHRCLCGQIILHPISADISAIGPTLVLFHLSKHEASNRHRRPAQCWQEHFIQRIDRDAGCRSSKLPVLHY